MEYVVPAPPSATLPVLGSALRFPVHRIYCVGRNYEDHAREMGDSGREPPFFFLKPADSALAAGADGSVDMPYPSLTSDLQHEVELVVAIGRGGRDIAVAQALQHVYGYAVGLDMTRRDLQAQMKKNSRPWCIGKAFEHAAPTGSITAATALAAPDALDAAAITLEVNGTMRQQSTTAHMIWSVAETIAQLSCAWTLQAGDLIFTGTPAGVAAVQRGDTMHARIAGLADLRVRVL